jgi:hypothetical protein
MPEEKKTDDVEKLLAEQRAFEDRKQALIDGILKEREAAMAAFDEKLAKLGYRANSSKSKRSHHKKGTPAADVPPKAAPKPKA